MLTLIPICSDGVVPTMKSAEPGLQDTDAKKLHMIFMATQWRPYTWQKGPFSFPLTWKDCCETSSTALL